MAQENPQILMNVTIENKQFEVNCGNGNQKMKWLCITSEQKYIKLQSNIKLEIYGLGNSKLGSREQPNSFYIPKSLIDSFTKELIHPDAIIKHVYPNGGCIEVILSKTLQLLPNGEPAYTIWQRLAFSQDEEVLKKLPKLSEYPIKERKMIREFERYNYSPEIHTNIIDISEEIQKDFTKIHLDTLLKQSDIVGIKKILLPHFSALHKLFIFYSYPKKMIRFKNFASLTKRCLNWDYNEVAAILDKHYSYTNNELSRYEFIECLIRITLIKKSNSKADIIETLNKELFNSLLNNTKSFLDSFIIKFFFNQDNQELIFKKSNRLANLFNKYSDSPDTISIQSFLKFLDIENLNKNKLNIQSKIENLYERETLSFYPSINFLVFPEFLEAILITIFENLSIVEVVSYETEMERALSEI